MTNLLKLACFLLPLSGCAPPLIPNAQVEADLLPYVNRFEQIWGSQVNFPIYQAVIDPQYGGICSGMGTGAKVVIINSLHWSTLGEEEKEQLVFHELGHCALNRQHREDLNPDGSPVSIMYHQMFGYLLQYSVNKQTYIKELFGR